MLRSCPTKSKAVLIKQRQHSRLQFAHNDYSVLTTITVCSQRLQFAHNDYSLLTTTTVCSQRLQFAYNDYSLLTTTTVCSQQLQFAWCIWNANLHWLLTFFHLARIIYIRCIYGIFGRGITKYTVYIYGFGQPYTFSYILVPFFGHRTASGLTNV